MRFLEKGDPYMNKKYDTKMTFQEKIIIGGSILLIIAAAVLAFCNTMFVTFIILPSILASFRSFFDR